MQWCPFLSRNKVSPLCCVMLYVSNAGQGLGKEWERKYIRFDKRALCKSSWISLQRPWHQAQQQHLTASREQLSHPAANEVKGSAGCWPVYPNHCYCLSHHLASRLLQTPCSLWCFLCCFSFVLNDINCGLSLKCKHCVKLNFCLFPLVRHGSVFLCSAAWKKRKPSPSCLQHVYFFQVSSEIQLWNNTYSQHVTVLWHCVEHSKATLYLHNSLIPRDIVSGIRTGRFGSNSSHPRPIAHQCFRWRCSCREVWWPWVDLDERNTSAVQKLHHHGW